MSSLLPARDVLADRLADTTISVNYREMPTRQVFEDFAARTGLPVVGRYLDDRVGYGIDPELPITLEVEDKPARDVLEILLSVCEADGEPCTWQIRLGYIEVGTKARLSVPAAFELRRYDITEQMFEVADYGEQRRHPTVIGIETVESIVNTIEPGIWDYGQNGDEDEVLGPWWTTGHGGAATPGALPVTRTRTGKPVRVYREPRSIGTIRLWRKQLIVLAPDYVHRQLGGYGKEID